MELCQTHISLFMWNSWFWFILPQRIKVILAGYADAGYLSDPYKGRSQTCFVFTYGDTAISWRSVKQIMGTTLSNHSEILAIHEESHECIWLRSMIQHIRESCGLSSTKDIPTTLFEDNATCIAQITCGYIKGDRIKHIHWSSSTHISSIRETMSIFRKYGQVKIWQIYSQKHFWHLHSRSWYIKLECAASNMLYAESRVYLIMGACHQ